MTVQAFNPSDLSQSAANWAVSQRIVGTFAPHAQVAPNLTLALDPGNLLNGTTLTEVNAQSVGPFAPPASGFRIDRVVVDRSTGAASIVAGTANSLTPPAIPAGKLPVARVMLLPTTDAITNDAVVDERALSDASADSTKIICYANKNGIDQPLSVNGSWTTVSFPTTKFNIGGAFSTANNRFMPGVPGCYQVSACLNIYGVTDGAQIGVALAVNGTLADHLYLAVRAPGGTGTTHGAVMLTTIIQLVQPTDYIEVKGYQGTGTTTPFIEGADGATWFAASLIN